MPVLPVIVLGDLQRAAFRHHPGGRPLFFPDCSSSHASSDVTNGRSEPFPLEPGTLHQGADRPWPTVPNSACPETAGYTGAGQPTVPCHVGQSAMAAPRPCGKSAEQQSSSTSLFFRMKGSGGCTTALSLSLSLSLSRSLSLSLRPFCKQTHHFLSLCGVAASAFPKFRAAHAVSYLSLTAS